jgi:hypothetical protein
MAYPTRIRIRNVSDTRYGCFLKYPCFVGVQLYTAQRPPTSKILESKSFKLVLPPKVEF